MNFSNLWSRRSLPWLGASVGSLALATACSGGPTSVSPAAPGDASAASRTSPAVRARTLPYVTTVNVPPTLAQPEVLSADGSGGVYFGGPGTVVPGFCLFISSPQCQSGAAALIRYSGGPAGAFTQTQPHGPYFTASPQGNGNYCPGGYNSACSIGNVSAIDATDFPSVMWASDYTPDVQADIPFSELQWGGSGGTATLPPAADNHDFRAGGAEIVSIVHASNGHLWIGGGGPDGAALYPAAVPSPCSSSSTACDSLFLANGPSANVWAMTRTYNPSTGTPDGSEFYEFSPSGSLLKRFHSSNVAIRIAGTAHAIWFTDYAHDAIGKLGPNGSVTEFAIPSSNAGPYGIAAAADGSIWFDEYDARKVGRLDPATGQITEVSVAFQPFSIAATPPGCRTAAVWVGSLTSKLAEITSGP